MLLILAGITISAITGNESIMEKAQEAKENTEEVAKQEQIELDKISSKLEPEWDGTVATSFAEGSGNGDSEDTAYIIENGAQLAYLASQVNAGNDFSGKFISITKSINLGDKEFTPIGLGNSEVVKAVPDWSKVNSFNGVLNGNSNVITGINIKQDEQYGVGLIGVLGENGTVKNIVLYEGKIQAYGHVGGIVGTSKGIIEKCQNSIILTGSFNVGGIVGYAYIGSITNCINSGTIIANTNQVGGIVGGFAGSIIENCSNSGDIIASNLNAGGIAGVIFSGNIENCSNSGTVTGRNQVAGISGFVSKKSETDTIKITNCINTGNISTNNVDGRHGAGGIVGTLYSINAEISNVYNSGKVNITSSSRTNNFGGGIVGSIAVGKTIKNAYNRGEVINENTEGTIGAIAGLSSVENVVSNCYYYLPQGSSLAGIGGQGASQTGTEGNINYNYNSLNEFLRAIR